MKRVLLVTYYFPPNPAVGSLRAAGLAKYLPGFGWEPVVLAAAMPGRPDMGFRVIEVPYRDPFGLWKRILGIDARQNIMAQVGQLKKRLHVRSERSLLDRLVTLAGEITAYPDPQKGWKGAAIRAGGDFLGREPVDAIISSSSPYTGHIVARTLKLRHGIPWVADLRDLWTQNHYYPYSRIRRRIERGLELRTLSSADALVTVSGPLTQKLEQLHRGKPAHTITNGFDPGEVNNPPARLTDTFTVTYTGNLYPGRQSPEPLFAALKDLIAEGRVDPARLEVRFYGAEAGWIDGQAGMYGLKGLVRQYGLVPRSDALDRQRESQVLLLLKWNDPAERGTYSAKVFDYLAARRPILAVGGYEDVVSHLLKETRAGFDGCTLQGIQSFLRKAYQEYREAGAVSYAGQEEKVDTYSQTMMARRFAAVLNNTALPPEGRSRGECHYIDVTEV